jgi:hypothetical protein
MGSDQLKRRKFITLLGQDPLLKKASPRSGREGLMLLIKPLPCKAISPTPKLANGTPFAFVVDPFLVRASDYAVGHDN